MATTTVQTNNKGIKFRQEVNREWVRSNLFSPYIGRSPSSIIHMYTELQSRTGGDTMNVPLLAALRGAGRGAGTLVGNEEALDDYGCRFWIDWCRNAVEVKKSELKKQSADIWQHARPSLTDWANSMKRNEIIEALMSLPSESPPAGIGSDAGDRVNGIRYELASAGQRNTWNQDNADRVLYGNATSNYNATHATALATVDATADKYTYKSSDIMKYMAKHADPKIRPVRTQDSKEYFVCFHGSLTFMDLSESLKTVNADARPRNVQSNPLFQDGDLLWRGVVHREIPEIDDYVDNVWTSLNTAGDNSTPVYPVFLCGQSAIGHPVGQMFNPTTRKEDDYGFIEGLGIEGAYGVGKLFKKHPKSGSALVQWGMVTGFFAASAV